MAVLTIDMPANKEGPGEFEGYGTPNFVMLPRIFIRHQMQDLTEAELKVMLYIFDHTWGYTDGEGNRKDADAISRSQFLNGIRRLNGTQLDRGAGVSDRSLDRALDSLVKRGYIFRHRRMAASGRSDTNIYELNRYGKPCLASQNPALGLPLEVAAEVRLEGGADNQGGEAVSSHSPAHLDSSLNKTANDATEQDNDHSGKFSPSDTQRVESTPANLRPSTPANLPDTIENPNKEKIKQHTTQSNPLDIPGSAEKKPDQNNPVWVPSGSGSKGDSKQTSSTSYNLKSADGSQTSFNSAKPGPLAGSEEKEKATKIAKTVSSYQSSKDPIRAELASDLLRAGVAKKEADYLAGLARHNGHNSDYVKQTLEYIDRQRSVHSREGLLIHLVKTNWQPFVQEATGADRSKASGMVVPLPPASSIRTEQLPRLIEIEKRNLAEASSDFERQTAQARLKYFQTIVVQLDPNEV